jgi:ParB-like chromosome segregation protein Spo0J
MADGWPAGMPPIEVAALPDGRRVIINGHHRAWATTQLGRTTIPAIITQLYETAARDAMWLANVRSQLGPSSKQKQQGAVELYRHHPDWPHQRIATLMGLSREAISKQLQAEAVRLEVDPTGKFTQDLTAQSWRAIGTLGSVQDRRWLAQEAAGRGWTGKQVEAVAQALGAGQTREEILMRHAPKTVAPDPTPLRAAGPAPGDAPVGKGASTPSPRQRR